MQDLISSKLYNRVVELRTRIAERTAELNIQPDHDQTGHYYKYNGVRYPSVTGALQILKDPGLINWKMNKALEHIRTNYDGQLTEELLNAAKLAPQLEFEGAGDMGSIVHDWRERWFSHLIKGGYSGKFDWPGAGDPRIISACRAIELFVKQENYIPLACELYVADPEGTPKKPGLGVGGTLDDLGLINGKLALVDLKTSNQGAKDSYYAQVCLYLYMFKKLYKIHPKEVYILHVSKENGTYNLIPLHRQVNIIKVTNWAKRVVEVSKGLEELRNDKKVRPIII